MEIENLSIVIHVAVENAVNNIAALQNKVENFAAKTYDFHIFKQLEKQMDALKSYTERAENALNSTKNACYSGDLANFKSAVNEKTNALKAFYAQQETMAKQMRDSEIDCIKAVRDTQIQYYEDEINDLKSLLKGVKTENLDEGELKKIQALYDQLKYENDDVNRYYIEKAIEQAEAAFNERKQVEKIQDQIEEYQKKIAIVKENAQTEIQQVQKAAEAKISAIKAEAEEETAMLRAISAQREKAYQSLQKNINDSLESYDKSAESMKETSEKTVKDIMEYVRRGQAENVGILEGYSSKYGSAGDTLGQSFSQAFGNYISVVEQRIEGLRVRLENLLYSAQAVNYGQSTQNISHVNSLGGITQNFYSESVTPYEARKMAEDIINRLF